MNSIGTYTRRWLLCGLTGVALLNTAQSALIVDLQAVSATGATVINPKSIANATVGAVISFDIFAQISGANGDTTDDGLTSLAGGFFTQDGGAMRGNVSNVTRNSLFDANGSSIGTANNAPGTGTIGDADGDIDWGGTNPGSATGWFAVRGDTQPISGISHLLGTVNLTLTSVTPGEMTFNFVKRDFGTGANWREDGVTLSNTSGSYSAGGDITISAIPEPGTYALVAVGLAGLVGWRRKKTAG